MSLLTRLIIPSIVAMVTMMVNAQKSLISNTTEAQLFLDEYNRMAEEVFYSSAEAAWTFNTNITVYNQQVMLNERLESSRFSQVSYQNASRFNLSVMQPLMRREFIKIMDIGTSAQTNETKLRRLNEIESEMETIYSTAKVCLSPSECLPLDPDLTRLLATSRDYDRLLAAWKGWRDATGPNMKHLYTEFVKLSNEAVRMMGHADTGAYWRSWYDSPDFEDEVRALFDQLKPLYEHLHAFARRHLMKLYGEDKFPLSGHIPAHLLGNMWAQQWSSLVDEFTPFAGKPSLDVTPEMVRQNYTAKKIFETADKFFDSLGMIQMPELFWNKSMFEKPTDGRDVVCHASAWDFYNRQDFRIKQCTAINQEHLEIVHHEMGHVEYYLLYKDLPVSLREGANPVKQCTDITQEHLETAHHEMGHVEYFLLYKDQPVSFRDGANPGFHEAVGDVISLSVQTPEHMHSIGLLPSVSHDEETDINFLMSMALQKIAFLPFGYLIDQWRWSVFRGETKPDQYNEHWWNLRCRYQGVSPPVERTSSDFDPGAKFHIPGNTPYIRYFVSFVIQFQFHKAACQAANHTGPLHRCDIFDSKDAGTALSNMLKLGSSRPWTEAMEQLTGQTKMDAQPLMDYFEPLLKYLRKENDNDYGWHPQCPELYTEDKDKDSSSRIAVSTSTLLFAILSFYKLH